MIPALDEERHLAAAIQSVPRGRRSHRRGRRLPRRHAGDRGPGGGAGSASAERPGPPARRRGARRHRWSGWSSSTRTRPLERGWADAIGALPPDVAGARSAWPWTLRARASAPSNGGVRLRLRLFALPYGDQGIFARRGSTRDRRHPPSAADGGRRRSPLAAGRGPPRLPPCAPSPARGGGTATASSAPRCATGPCSPATPPASLRSGSRAAMAAARLDRLRAVLFNRSFMGNATPRAAITAARPLTCPSGSMTNADLEKIVDTSDEWIARARDPAAPHRRAGHSHQRAGRARGTAWPWRSAASARTSWTSSSSAPSPRTRSSPPPPASSSTRSRPRRPGPSTSPPPAPASPYALTVGAQFIASGAHRKVLVIGADVMSTIIDYQDRTTCVLFGDGAGAVLLEPSTGRGRGSSTSTTRSDGSGGCLPEHAGAGGSARPASHETVDQRMHYVRQDGPHVFKYAVRKFAEASQTVLEPQRPQAVRHRPLRGPSGQRAHHRRLPRAAGLPEAKVVKNIERYGNTTAATIPSPWGRRSTRAAAPRARGGHDLGGGGLTVGSDPHALVRRSLVARDTGSASPWFLRWRG